MYFIDLTNNLINKINKINNFISESKTDSNDNIQLYEYYISNLNNIIFILNDIELYIKQNNDISNIFFILFDINIKFDVIIIKIFNHLNSYLNEINSINFTIQSLFHNIYYFLINISILNEINTKTFIKIFDILSCCRNKFYTYDDRYIDMYNEISIYNSLSNHIVLYDSNLNKNYYIENYITIYFDNSTCLNCNIFMNNVLLQNIILYSFTLITDKISIDDKNNDANNDTDIINHCFYYIEEKENIKMIDILIYLINKNLNCIKKKYIKLLFYIIDNNLSNIIAINIFNNIDIHNIDIKDLMEIVLKMQYKCNKYSDLFNDKLLEAIYLCITFCMDKNPGISIKEYCFIERCKNRFLYSLNIDSLNIDDFKGYLNLHDNLCNYIDNDNTNIKYYITNEFWTRELISYLNNNNKNILDYILSVKSILNKAIQNIILYHSDLLFYNFDYQKDTYDTINYSDAYEAGKLFNKINLQDIYNINNIIHKY